jgi:hypothetical protein
VQLRGVTSRARSRPCIDGSASISSRACCSGIAPGNTPPFIAPGAADVPHERAGVDAGDRRDAAVAQPVQPAALGAGASSRLPASRMIAARAWMRSDSIPSALTP